VFCEDLVLGGVEFGGAEFGGAVFGDGLIGNGGGFGAVFG